jgi:thymidylate synthase ThyX
VPYEAAMVIGAMVDLVKEVDPMFFDKIGLDTLERDTLPELAFPGTRASGDAYAAEFDRRLGGRVSRLRDWSAGAERVVADAVRATFGLTTAELDDAEAIDRVMNPARNPYRVDMLDVAYHSPMMRTLHHATYVFEKRLSHTADSQDQRHRMVPASRPMMTLADTIAPDYVTPRLIRQNAAALAVYELAMADAWTAKNRLLALGVPLEYALYVLPNAKALRLVESGSFIALQHKWTLRTCFNAQEEIYLASMDEIGQVQAIHPQLGRYLGPPCVLRNKIVAPRCTEGSHFCGVPVWQSFPNVARRL